MDNRVLKELTEASETLQQCNTQELLVVDDDKQLQQLLYSIDLLQTEVV